MQEVPPCVVSSFISFTSNPNLESPSYSSENTFGCISRDGTWSWIAHGSLLEVFTVHTKERCGVCYFGAKSRNSAFTITAIEEFSSTHLSFPCLLVALDTSSDGGLLCVFNVKTSKVISAIQLPYKVTSLTVISTVGGATMETYVLNNHLRCMFGIAAVGTECGNVLLVDLCLDAENYSDEMTPNKVVIVSKSVQSLPSKREVSAVKNQHICIFLNDRNFNSETFEYRNSHKILASFSSADVIVSALKFIRNLAVLVVGFNFGGIQLWNLQHLNLEISIPIHSSQQPLVHFAFQEPENDPRNFCYVWAIRGHYQGENYRPENVSIATLYALSYAKRDWIPRYGFFYEKLQGCTKRFEYALTSDPYNPRLHFSSHCSRLITCDVISQNDLLSRLDIEDPLQNEEWCSAEDLSLCLMAWENWPTTGSKPASSYLALFDINQWYQAQMPSFLRCNYGEMCSYLGVFSLKEVSTKTNMDSLLAISVVPNSLSKFKSLSIAEETFFPSSMSFKIWCLSTNGMLQATYLGAQRQLLAEMNLTGPSILIEPKELYKRCVTNGLLNQHHVGLPVNQLTAARQREALLTLALEHSMIQFLSACVQSWKNTEFIHVGCSTKFLLEWVWKVITETKTTMDKLCLPLFNCSGQALDENALITLHIFKSRLKYLSDVIAAFQNLSLSQSEQGHRELQLRKEVVDSLSTYLHVLIWLYDSKLLPEHPEGDEYGEDEVAYPVTLFNRTYSYRRSELEKLHSSVCGREILLIDGLVEDFGDSLVSMWEKKGGSKNYPPPSIYAAVSSYLTDGISLHQKHMLMYYLLLDMAAYLTDRQSHLVEKLSSFCQLNNVSSSLNKLTQAFWHLDHQDFEVAVTILVDPIVLTCDISYWQHMRIIKSLLYQGEPRKALKYISIRMPPDDTEEAIKLHLSVLLANELIVDAFNYLRQNQNESNIADLLTHMFLGCQQTHCLNDLLQLPLSTFESTALSNYLHSCRDPKAQEILIMFHLLRCQPLEALNLNERLITQVMERSLKTHERSTARNALVAGFVDTLPEEQRKLAQELSQIYSHIEKREVNPQPLSTNVTCNALTYISYADMLKSIMDNFPDSPVDSSRDPYTPFRSWKPSVSTTPFIRPPITPESRKRKCVPDFMNVPQDNKRASARMDCSEFMTPLKKSRSFDIRSFKLADTDYREKAEEAMRENLLSLLQTPPVCRVSSTICNSTLMHRVNETTPLSILKTKMSNQEPFNSGVQDSLFSKTPSVCSELSKEAELSENELELGKKTEETIQSRHLRFQVPPTDENIQCTISRVSPRRPLHGHKMSIVSSPVETEDRMSASGDVQYFASVACSDDSNDVPILSKSLSAKTENSVKQSALQDLTLSHHESALHTQNKFYDDSFVCSSEKKFDFETNIDETNTSEDSNNLDVSFVSIHEDMGCDDENDKVDDVHINSDSNCSFKSVGSEDGMHGIVSSEWLHDPTKIHEQLSTVPDSGDRRSLLDVEFPNSCTVTPEKKEATYSASPYLGTRSRSKSVSPSRKSTENSPKVLLPQSVALFTAAEGDQKGNADLPSVDGMVPLLEAELPHPGTLTPEKQENSQSGSPYRIGRSRSRSKSTSPSRLQVKTSPKITVPHSACPSVSELVQGTVKEGDCVISILEAKIPQPDSWTPENNQVGTTFEFSPPHLQTRSKSRSPSRKVVPKNLSSVLHAVKSSSAVSQTVGEGKNEPFSSSASKLQNAEDVKEKQQASSVPDPIELKLCATPLCKQISEEVEVPVPTSPFSRTEESLSESSRVRAREGKEMPKNSVRVKSVRKKKSKNVKAAKKLKFSFSQPHSSADSEVLEALSATPSTDVTSFVFSPPASRTRTRQKMNDTLNSSAVTDKYSDSMVKTTVDPLLRDDAQNLNVLNTSSRQKKKPATKLKKSSKQPIVSSPHEYINFISPVVTTVATSDKNTKPLLTAKHSMVLRRSKKTVKLF